MTLKVCTYNIHKGFSSFNLRMMVHALRDGLRSLDPDIVFLQEVQGEHIQHATAHTNWPKLPQHEFLAENQWLHHAYGKNAIYAYGHHGNAILSRYPILSTSHNDMTFSRLEQRGFLHCVIQVPDYAHPVHCICVHLSLTHKQRIQQLALLANWIRNHVPSHEPLILAGDFNDWQLHAQNYLQHEANMQEAFTVHRGKAARSFPCVYPLLRLDRIYIRSLNPTHTEVLHGKPWINISDHAVLYAHLTPNS